MSITFIDKQFGSTFFNLLEECDVSIRIISPFIGYKTAESLANFLENSDVNCTIITRFYRDDFINGVSSLTGLERLMKSGAQIYALQELHTKLYIFDDQSVIMGSANFTMRGFYKNHEFGVYMNDEIEFTTECANYFDNILENIKMSGDWLITEERVRKEKVICDNLVAARANDQKKPTKNGYPVINKPNETKWGAILNIDSNMQSVEYKKEDFIENLFSNESFETYEKRNTGIWLKFEGNSENRIPNDVSFMERREKSRLRMTNFPRAPKGIKKGQLLFMTMVSYDIDGKETLMIVGYATTSGFNEKMDLRSSKENQELRYPYYVELENGRFLKSEIKYGISLKELARELSNDLYPTPKRNFNEIIYTHRQKSHIQITEKAKDYIINKLEELFKQYGVDELK